MPLGPSREVTSLRSSELASPCRSSARARYARMRAQEGSRQPASFISTFSISRQSTAHLARLLSPAAGDSVDRMEVVAIDSTST